MGGRIDVEEKADFVFILHSDGFWVHFVFPGGMADEILIHLKRVMVALAA